MKQLFFHWPKVSYIATETFAETIVAYTPTDLLRSVKRKALAGVEYHLAVLWH